MFRPVIYSAIDTCVLRFGRQSVYACVSCCILQLEHVAQAHVRFFIEKLYIFRSTGPGSCGVPGVGWQ